MAGKPPANLLRWSAEASQVGHPAKLWQKAKFWQLGLAKKKAIKYVTGTTEKATRWLWLKREAPWSTAAGA